jgi:hypothetical protein
MQASNVATTSADESDLTEGEGQELRLKTRAVVLPGAVLTVATYLGQYILTSAGNYVSSNPATSKQISDSQSLQSPSSEHN